MNTIKAALASLVLLLCLGQSGCDRPSLAIPHDQPTHDANGYLIQPGQDFLVGGERRGWKHLFIQFDVNGNEARPFVLCIENTMQPHDHWSPAPDPKKDKQSSSGLMLRPLEDPPRPWGWVSLNSEEVAMLAEAARKYSAWADTAAKESLNVEEKRMLSLTNQDFVVTFTKTEGSSNAFMNLYVPSSSLLQSSLPSAPCSITIDKLGVDRLLVVITNLQSRRDRFNAFRDEQEKIVRQRNEAEKNDKARADELLH